MKRITRRRSRRFLVDSWAETYSRKMEVWCEEANPFAVAFHRDVHLFEGVTGTEELYEALRKNGFQSLFVSQSEAWEALQRMDTSLLRAACWTMAPGMKLEKHVKAQCGEACKVYWCCEILSESGVPCGLRFRSKESTEMSSVAQQITCEMVFRRQFLRASSPTLVHDVVPRSRLH